MKPAKKPSMSSQTLFNSLLLSKPTFYFPSFDSKTFQVKEHSSFLVGNKSSNLLRKQEKMSNVQNRIPNCFTQTKSKMARAWSFYKSNPLCGIRLEAGAKFIAIVQMIFAAGVILIAMRVLIKYFQVNIPLTKNVNGTTVPHLEGIKLHENRPTAAIVLLFVACFLFTLWFILYGFLYKGIHERNYVIVNRCWKLMALIAFADMAQAVLFFFARGSIALDLGEVAIFATSMYALWVVYGYKEELKRGADLGGGAHVPANSTEDFQRMV